MRGNRINITGGWKESSRDGWAPESEGSDAGTREEENTGKILRTTITRDISGTS